MSQAPAWWEDVEHLREAAERRIAERERAQREGRDPVALPPLRPLRESERDAAPALRATPAPRPLEPAPVPPSGRFGRLTGSRDHATSPGAAARAAAAPAAARAVELEPAPHEEHDQVSAQPFAGFAALADDFRASLEAAARPERADEPAEMAPPRRRRADALGEAAPADELWRGRGAQASYQDPPAEDPPAEDPSIE